MEQQRYLIDTNAIIDYLGQKLPAAGMDFMNSIIDAVPNVSVITKIEVLGFNVAGEAHQLLVSFMNDAVVFNLTDPVVDRCIEVRRHHKTKLPDAIIAATALVHGFTIISRNTKDFQPIDGLVCLNPHEV